MFKPGSRARITGKGADRGFMALPHAVANSPNWLKLSPYAVKLFIDLYVQYKGRNNGDLCATWKFMAPRGWKSKETLQKALRELEHFGMIIRSRQGGRKNATLYAVTFKDIDDCQGKLDIRPGPPPGNWSEVVTLPVSCAAVAKGKAWGGGKKKTLPRPSGHLGTACGALPDGVLLH